MTATFNREAFDAACQTAKAVIGLMTLLGAGIVALLMWLLGGFANAEGVSNITMGASVAGVNAIGLVAMSGVNSIGLVSLSGVSSIGVIAIGGNAIGIVAFGSVNAIGIVALSGVNAVGVIAIGRSASGGYGLAYTASCWSRARHLLSPDRQDPEAVRRFAGWLPKLRAACPDN